MYQIFAFLSIVYLSCLFKGRLNVVAWPQCGEFVFPTDDTNLSADEKQFKRKLPTLFESYDCGNASGIDQTLKSLEKFKAPPTLEEINLEEQTLAPSLEIVSALIAMSFSSIELKEIVNFSSIVLFTLFFSFLTDQTN